MLEEFAAQQEALEAYRNKEQLGGYKQETWDTWGGVVSPTCGIKAVPHAPGGLLSTSTRDSEGKVLSEDGSGDVDAITLGTTTFGATSISTVGTATLAATSCLTPTPFMGDVALGGPTQLDARFLLGR